MAVLKKHVCCVHLCAEEREAAVVGEVEVAAAAAEEVGVVCDWHRQCRGTIGCLTGQGFGEPQIRSQKDLVLIPDVQDPLFTGGLTGGWRCTQGFDPRTNRFGSQKFWAFWALSKALACSCGN